MFIKTIKNIIQNYRQKKEYRKWSLSGKPIPVPHSVKQMAVKEYADKYKINVFIETGTYLGDMVVAIKDVFREIYTIELSAELYERAKNRFSKYCHIKIYKGDSAKVLPEILGIIKEPCLFWFDAHYSEGITAKGEKETPIVEELKYIIRHPIEGNVILIDDARLFTGNNDYPGIEEIRELILSRCPEYVFDVKDDIIRIHNKGRL